MFVRLNCFEYVFHRTDFRNRSRLHGRADPQIPATGLAEPTNPAPVLEAQSKNATQCAAGRGRPRVIAMDPSFSLLPRALPFFCLICPTRYPTRKLLLEHLRSDPEDTHKTLRFGACDSPVYHVLQQQGVLACPLGCGAYFNGGETGVSKPLEFHIARRNCHDRRLSATPTELDGPYLATTMVGIRTALTAKARNVRSYPNSAPPPPLSRR